MLEVGTKAPDFTLSDEEGNKVTLSSFQGSQSVVLIFYPGDQTPVCTMQLCAVRDDQETFNTAGVAVFGINSASASSHQNFVKQQNFQFPLLVDESNRVARMYKALLIDIGFVGFGVVHRTVYAIDKEGTIVFAERGSPSNQTILAALG